MISEVLLASYSFMGGGTFGDLLTRWEQMGFFSSILPFLLIFAIVFGVLSKSKIFDENKSINAIIALAVGFMSLQFGLVTDFFSQVFPRVGVGLAIVLIVILFLGIFLPKAKWADSLLLIIAAIIVLSILLGSSEAMGWQSYFNSDWNWPTILVIVGVLAAIIAIFKGGSGGSSTHAGDSDSSVFMKHMHKD